MGRRDAAGPDAEFQVGHHVSPPGLARIFDEDVLRDEAISFVQHFYDENKSPIPLGERLAAVEQQIAETGTYVHTRSELVWGARVAWRNSARCIGRLYWNGLRVRDLRAVQTVDEMAYHCVEHVRVSLNRGNIRPVMSVFAPETPASPGMRLLNAQLLGYAGYDRGGGDRLGDRNNRDLTMTALRSGWPAPRPPSPFDVLPLLIRDFDGHVHVRRLPPEATPEVRLRHPDLDWLEGLGLRWFALPVVSDMALYIGGINYPAVPFSGWFMSSEIAVRDLADRDRYDVLPFLARRMGLDPGNPTDFAVDRAALELLRAVHFSFDAEKVRITDHHTESSRFLLHRDREQAAGRSCPADWSWIVPPVSSALTPVFHQYYDFLPAKGPQLYHPYTTTGRAHRDRDEGRRRAER